MTRKRKKISERLSERLESLVGSKVVKIERLVAGHWQRSAGAWVWSASFENGAEVGSGWTMKQCLEAGTLEFGEHGTLIPEASP